MDTFCTNDGIERFESFSRKEDGWPKAANMRRKVNENMKFWLVEPLTGPTSSSKQESFNFTFQNTLLKYIKIVICSSYI